MSKLEELKQEATELGISYSANIGEAKLSEKIEAFYESQEASDPKIEAALKEMNAEKNSEEKSAVSGKSTPLSRAKAREKKARETKIVTVVDNDQRVNNQTTVAVTQCSNMYFDLGKVYVPLNVPVELMQGHIDNLKDVKIPMHVKDPKTGLSKVELRNRYSVSVEDIEKVK